MFILNWSVTGDRYIFTDTVSDDVKVWKWSTAIILNDYWKKKKKSEYLFDEVPGIDGQVWG